MLEQSGEVLELAALVTVVGSGFVGTNLDNLVILVGLLGAAAERRGAVIVGYMAAAISVLIVSLLGGLLGGLIDPTLVGYLGFIPLLLGGYMLFRAVFVPAVATPECQAPAEHAVETGAAGGLSAFTLMVSNSGDSIAVFLPLFAESGRDALILEVITYLLMVLVWVAAARAAAGRQAIARLLERYGPRIMPVVMMGVGVYVLTDTAFDRLLAG